MTFGGCADQWWGPNLRYIRTMLEDGEKGYTDRELEQLLVDDAHRLKVAKQFYGKQLRGKRL